MSDNRITIRLRPTERIELEHEAHNVGVSLSTHVRERLFQNPQTKPMYKPTETRMLVKHLIGHIGRVGNNLNQIAFKLNSDQMLRPIDRADLMEGMEVLKNMRSLLITHLLQRGPC